MRSTNCNDALSRVQEELALILTHAGEGIYGLDLEGKTTFVNNAAARMVGLKLEHLKGQCNHSLVHYKHQDGSDYPKSQCPIYATLQDGKPRHGDDEYFIRTDGIPFPIEYFANPIISEGKLKGVVVTFIDITERKQKEALLYQYQHKLEEIVEEKTKELQLANEELKRLSLTDGLTGIANRRCFDEVLNTEIRRAQRAGKPLTLILGDVDFFKKYNDSYGHQAGDDCLKKIACALSSVFQRAGDLVARYGGEEFAIIIPDLPFESVEKKAEQLLNYIHGLRIVHEYSDISQFVSMSLGIVHVIPDDSASKSLVELADEALYQAKMSGRNRYVVA